jgi:hypothetical protein
MRQRGWRWIGALVLVIALAACGGGDGGDDSGPRVTATITPVPPTWTPSVIPPSWTPAPYTPAPSFTPRPSDTPEPPPNTGQTSIGGEQVITLLQADANAAILAAYAAGVEAPLTAAPIVTLGANARVTIVLPYANTLLQETGQVIAQGQFSVGEQGIRFVERREIREQSGALAAEPTLLAGVALVEVALSEAVRAQIDPAQRGRGWVRVVVYPGYLRVVLASE